VRNTPWAQPLVDLGNGIVGHLLCWELHERDGTSWAWVSWIQQTGGRHVHKVVQVRGTGLQPLDSPEAYADVPGCEGTTG
jgi:hypothetical protein